MAAVTPLPGPSNPTVFDDFGGGGTFGSTKQIWYNWWNQDGGTGSFAKTTVDGRTVGKFAQTPASNKSWAKFEPFNVRGDFTGYRYLSFTMKNPGYPEARVKLDINDGEHAFGLSGGWIAVDGDWTTYTYDLNQYAGINKKTVYINLWLKQQTGVYGEILVDEIKAVNTYSGTPPTLTGTGVQDSSGNVNTLFNFTATYTDAENRPPYAVQLVVNDTTVYPLEETDLGDLSYADGKGYKYATKLPAGVHSFYFRTTDTESDTVTTPPQQITVSDVYTAVTVNDSVTGTADSQFEYIGSGWQTNSAAAGSYMSDTHYSVTGNVYMQYRFTGTQISLYGSKGPANGIAGVSIDGGYELMVDTYAASAGNQALLFASPQLDNGHHILKVRVTGEKRASSTGTTVAIDKISQVSFTGSLVEQVQVSQAGYGVNDYKFATVTTVDALQDQTYRVLDGTGAAVWSGIMKDEGITWGKRVYSLDFTPLAQTGEAFTIESNGISSYPFPIELNMWDKYKDEMTAFYRLQRTADTTLSYPAGYSDIAPSAKIFHPDSYLDNAASTDGTQFYDLTGGWFDAGDYGKYPGNQWVAGEIALAYLRHADAASVQFDNDGNGVPDLIDEAKYGSEYLLKFANQFGGALYLIKNNSGFQHPDKATDNIPGTADDTRLGAEIQVGGSGKAAGALAATARAIYTALDKGQIDAAKTVEMRSFADSCTAAAITFYNHTVANANGPQGSYSTIGGIPNTQLWAEVELFLLTGNTDYKTSAAARIDTSDVYTTNYWDVRPLAMAEFYPVADTATQAKIHTALKNQADYFMSIADDEPYGVLNKFSNFGINEPHASYLGDLLRYYELFGDAEVLQSVQKGLYWIFGNNPWNMSWVSGIGTDYVNYLHTRLDTQVNDHANQGVVLPGAMVSGPNMKDTTDRKSISPWYKDRQVWEDDITQWRYNEFSISIQAGLLYTIMGLSDTAMTSNGNSAAPVKLTILNPVIDDYVIGNVQLTVKPEGPVQNVEYKGPGMSSIAPMTVTGDVYTAAMNVDALALLTNLRAEVRGIDSSGRYTYSATHFTVGNSLPDPSHSFLYDDFAQNGYFGAQNLSWVSWWSNNGGSGTYTRTTADGRSIGKFTQTPTSNKSQAKFQPWKDNVDLTGYRYISVTMKSDYPDTRVSFMNTWIPVTSEWATYDFDMNKIANLDKANVDIIMWVSQATGQYGEVLIDEIIATNKPLGTAPTLTGAGVTQSTGVIEAVYGTPVVYTFQIAYTDADNAKPHAVEPIIDGGVHKMKEADSADTVYSNGKIYYYSTTLAPGPHSYYFRTTDTTSAAIVTPVQTVQ